LLNNLSTPKFFDFYDKRASGQTRPSLMLASQAMDNGQWIMKKAAAEAAAF